MSAFDLFGNPVRDGFGEKGRPPYEVTDENRNKVMLLLACGWKPARIAGALDITTPTLRKYFVSELEIRQIALDRLEAQQFSMVFECAKTGNVQAIKELGALVEKMRAQEADRFFDGRKRPSEKAKPLGKKEEQAQAAHGVGGIFAPPAGPSQVN